MAQAGHGAAVSAELRLLLFPSRAEVPWLVNRPAGTWIRGDGRDLAHSTFRVSVCEQVNTHARTHARTHANNSCLTNF